MLRIDRHGSWRREDPDAFLARTLLADERGAVPGGGDEFPFGAGDQPVAAPARPSISAPAALQTLDVVFPVLHGPYGEDGSVQGMLKTAGIPFAGPGVLAAAVGMDKDVMKRLLVGAGIPVADFRVAHASDPQPWVGCDRRAAGHAGVRQAGQPGIVGRHPQGGGAGGVCRSGRAGIRVRQQDRHRARHRRARDRVRRAGQRQADRVAAGRSDPPPRVLQLRGEVPGRGRGRARDSRRPGAVGERAGSGR